jgi:hypothetical protein
MGFIGRYRIKFTKEGLFETKPFARARNSDKAGDIDFLKKSAFLIKY